jgi:hypothetical protein
MLQIYHVFVAALVIADVRSPERARMESAPWTVIGFRWKKMTDPQAEVAA